jgi:hypothetical protein
MRVLVACEFSGVVRDAFIRVGHEAMSCDLLPTERPGPHYKGDVFDILFDDWDMIIAFPPCTYMSKAGARFMYPTAGNVDKERLVLARKAKEFFMMFYNHPCQRVAIENPTPLKIVGLPEPTQIIQPYQFGHPYSKRTLLWLKGLPKLIPTNVLDPFTPYLPSNTGGFARGKGGSRGVAKNAKEASKTFGGVADAMANQWGELALGGRA